MRRKDREMPENFAISIIDKCEWATMSLVDKDCNPYCVTITIVRKDNSIYFHSAKEGYKIDCLKNNNNVCISCVGDTHRLLDMFTTEYESAMVKGIATEVVNSDEAINVLRLLCLRHTPTNMNEFDNAIGNSLSRTAVWRVDITEITAKRKKYDSNRKELKFNKKKE